MVYIWNLSNTNVYIKFRLFRLRRKISGCTFTHGCSVAKRTTIQYNILYLSLYLFLLQCTDVLSNCLRNSGQDTPGQLGLCAYNWLLIIALSLVKCLWIPLALPQSFNPQLSTLLLLQVKATNVQGFVRGAAAQLISKATFHLWSNGVLIISHFSVTISWEVKINSRRKQLFG